jgi:HK97 family phage prohead protease
MSDLIKKYYGLKALDVDSKTKRVKVAISQLEDIDRDNDVFSPTAYDKTIKENGPKGSNEIWHLLDHTLKSFSALSKFSEIGREGKYITGVSLYKNSFAWREVAWPLYEAGDITQHSVGFHIEKADDRDKKGIRVIREVKLYEGSAVLWGAQKDTPTMQVVKNLLHLEDDRDITMAEKIDEIIKKIKSGRFDEDKSIFIIELKRIQQLFGEGQVLKIFQEPEETTTLEEVTQEEKTTEPEIKSTLPATTDCPSCNRFTENTQEEKGFIKCHRCDAVFVYGSKTYLKI